MQIEDSTTKIREDPRSNLWGPHSGVLNPAAPIYNSLCEIVYDSGEVNFLCCSVHFFEFKKFEFDFFCWTQGKCLPLQLSIFKLSCKISIFTTKKKLALSSLFLSSLSLRLFAASAALSHDALSLSRNLLRSSLSTLYLYLYLYLSLSLSLWKKNYEFV